MGLSEMSQPCRLSAPFWRFAPDGAWRRQGWQKADLDEANLILVCPCWSTQPWYTHIMKSNYDCIYFDREEVQHSINRKKVLPVKRFMAVRITH